jgi:hypothetical protein
MFQQYAGKIHKNKLYTNTVQKHPFISDISTAAAGLPLSSIPFLS